MRYLALAVDYDGTIAEDGRVQEETIEALETVLASGRRIILVTGRQLDDLRQAFDRLDLFERVVAENGALLYCPETREERLLAEPYNPDFVEELRRRDVTRVSTGRSIVATWEPHEHTALQVIRDMGLELEVIFNKGAVMVLPTGVNKATGLQAALDDLGLSPHNVVGIGDAENDHGFLALCRCSAAVANAIDTIKARADFVTRGSRGDGVVQLARLLVEEDMAPVEPRLVRHNILLGTTEDGSEFRVPSMGVNLLFTGSSGAGKSTAATGVLERLSERGYQFCIVDPEGDYESFDGALVLGSRQQAPSLEEITQVLAGPRTSLAVNLLGFPLEARPGFFAAFLPRLQELRASSGRPHWIVIDEAHHMLPQNGGPASAQLPQKPEGIIVITVHPALVAREAISSVDIVVTVGKQPVRVLSEFAAGIGAELPATEETEELEPGVALVWDRRDGRVFLVRVQQPKQELKRHERKYAEGDLGPDNSFYFRGPQQKLNLRAQNLLVFSQIAEGVDDETWTFHLQERDYSRWFRDCIKDGELAREVAEVEQARVSPTESRRLIREAVEARYTLPAQETSGWESDEPDHQTVSPVDGEPG